MQWQIITISDLYDAKAAPLITAVQTTCLAAGQPDPIPELIANATEEVRGAMGFSGKYMLSATLNSLPPNLVDMVVQRIVRLCKRRLEQPLTQDERDDEKQFQDKLGKLMAGKWPIANPDDPILVNPTAPGGTVSSFGNTCRDYSRWDTQNL